MSIYWFLFIAIFIFWLLGRNSAPQPHRSLKMSFDEAKFIIALVAKVAKSDGKISKIEAEFIGQILDDLKTLSGCSSTQREELRQIYNIEKENLSNTFSLAFEYKKSFFLNYTTCINRVYFLLNLAYIDGEFSAAERETIDQICDGLGFDEFTKKTIFDKFKESYAKQNKYYQNYSEEGYGQNPYKTSSKKDPYEILDIAQSSSFEEIRAKYRKLVKKYHPDILMGKGADTEIIQEGTRRLQEINEAYEIIKTERGK